MAPTLGITGATGLIGGGVSRHLEQAGVAHRLLVRNPAKVEERVAASGGLLESAPLDFGRPEEAVASMAGLDTVLFVSATETEDRARIQQGFVEALRRAGVRQVLYLSFAAAAEDATFTYARTHWKTEQAVRAAGLDFTFLRDNFYLDVLPEFADEHGVLRGPAGEGRVSAVSRADVVDAATAVLKDPRAHAGRTYTLTGPEALSLEEAAAIMTRVSGRPYRFEDETLEQARESRAAWNPEPWMLDGWISTYTAIASGELEPVTEDVRWLTGHAPRGLAEVMRERQG